MKKPINTIKIEGRVYDHTLAEKVTGETSKHPGTPYIGGTIDIATDDALMNVVTVHFTYVTEVTNKGNKNATYGVLKNIINNGKTIVADGPENATMVRITNSALALNDFYSNRTGEEVLVSAKRNSGGFVSIINALDENEKNRNRFEFDMLINGTLYVEADPERNIENDYLIVKGAVFDFKKAILPVELVVKSEGGIRYFENFDASQSNPVFTKVWGNVESQTFTIKKEEESAFGEASVKEYSRTVREYVITGAPQMTYEIGDAENGITAEDVKQAIADREEYLAQVKARQDEYQASKNAGTQSVNTSTSISAADGGFNF